MNKMNNIDWEALEKETVDIKFDALPANIREWVNFANIYEKCVEAMNNPDWDPSTPECVTGDFDAWRLDNLCFGMQFKRSPFELFNDLKTFSFRDTDGSKRSKEDLKNIIENHISFDPIIYVNRIFDVIKNGIVSLDFYDILKTPKYIKGDITWNAPTFENCPKMVGGKFEIKSKQSSLIGCPDYVGGDFTASTIGLSSIEGIPKEIGGRLTLSGNEITDISKLTSININGAIHVSNNNLTHLPALKTTGNIFAESNKIKTFEVPECGILWLSSSHEDYTFVEAELKNKNLKYILVDRPFGKVFKVFVKIEMK